MERSRATMEKASVSVSIIGDNIKSPVTPHSTAPNPPGVMGTSVSIALPSVTKMTRGHAEGQSQGLSHKEKPSHLGHPSQQTQYRY